MRRLITLLVLLFLTYLASANVKTCHSTGDPHYKNFFGKSFNVYGIEGDFDLVSSVSRNFQVQTRVQYGQWWANRAVNSAVSIIADGNKLVHFGSHYFINGAKNGALRFNHGASIKKINNNRFEIKSKTGEVVLFDFFNANAKKANFAKFYFNIYVSVPSARKYTGLCTWKSGAFKSYILKTRDAFTTYKVLKPRVIKIKPIKIKWASKAIEQRAIRYCRVTLKLRGTILKDCISDIREARGDLKAGAGYKRAAKDIEEIKRKRRALRKAEFAKCAKTCPCLKKYSQKKQKVRVVTKCKRIKRKVN